jgi:ABC-type Fe3+ transport system permease subunit
MRSAALNRIYHLGSSSGSSQQAIRALALRGAALNQTYHLGTYADVSQSSFNWGSFGIGGAAALTAIVIALMTAVGVRRRHAAIPV